MTWRSGTKLGLFQHSVLKAVTAEKEASWRYLDPDGPVHCGLGSLNRDIQFSISTPSTNYAKVLFKIDFQISIFSHVNQLFLQRNWNMLHFNALSKWILNPLKLFIWKTFKQAKKFLFFFDIKYLRNTQGFQQRNHITIGTLSNFISKSYYFSSIKGTSSKTV